MEHFALISMAIGTPGWQEIVLIGLLFLLLFGARRLPEIGQSLGKGIREFKKSVTGSDEEPKLGSGDSDAAQAQQKQKEEAS
jgi:sec-independent protein translocase protein TatA